MLSVPYLKQFSWMIIYECQALSWAYSAYLRPFMLASQNRVLVGPARVGSY